MNYRTAKSNMEANLNYIEGFQKKTWEFSDEFDIVFVMN